MMGELLDLFKGIPLPPEIEDKMRLLDLRFEQMKARVNDIVEAETRNFDELEPQKGQRYTTQRMINPDEPTDAETAVLKLMQPPGRQVNAPDVAQHLKLNATVAQHHLSELQRKRYVSQHIKRGGYRRPAGPPRYSLTDKGIKHLVDHGLTD